jgi:hypothetical protein
LLLAVGAAAAVACLVLLAPPASSPWLSAALSRGRPLAPFALVGAGAVLSLTLAHHLVPALSRHLSPSHLVDRYRQHRDPEATLLLHPAVMTSGGFDRARTRRVADLDALAEAFQRDPALFALVPRAELAALHDRFSARGARYVVADASSSRLLLLAARPLPGLPDQNPLADGLWRPGLSGGDRPPWPAPAVKLGARFGGAVDLVGVDFPPVVRRPGRLTLTLHLRVTAPPPAGYKIFVHLEGPGSSVNGDHAPLEGTFPTELWRPGDWIRDRHEIELPLVVASAGRHAIHVGFWPGGDTPRRLPVTAGPSDGRNRVPVGTVEVR